MYIYIYIFIYTYKFFGHLVVSCIKEMCGVNYRVHKTKG